MGRSYLLLGLSMLVLVPSSQSAQASQAIPAAEPVASSQENAWRKQVLNWLADQSPSAREAAARAWSEAQPQSETQHLDWICLSIARVDPRARELLHRCRHPQIGRLPDTVWLADQDTLPAWAADHLRLVCGRELMSLRHYDEALAALADVAPEQVATPATLLFCRAVSNFHLLRLNDAQSSLEQLSQLEACPRRYRELAALMQHDLEQFEPDSLDHIARLMRDVERRLDHGFVRGTVRRLEDDVVARLDRLIEALEQEPGDGPGPAEPPPSWPGPGPHSCAPPNGGNHSTQPADASSPLPGGAAGNVESARSQAEAPWGNLDEAERERILQQVGGRFPSHYRDAIEQYFRKIAK